MSVRRTTFLSSAATLASMAVLSACLVGCDGGTSQTSPTANAASDTAFGEADQTYIVRGRIIRLPSAGPPPIDLTVHHEHIPEFVGKTGDVHMNPNGEPGMLAMRMPFPLVSPDVDLSAFSEGDVVAMTFEVRWIRDAATGDATRPTWRVTNLEPLPVDTELEL